MAMSEEEKAAYLVEIDEPIQRLVDESLMRLFGRTYREPRVAELTHAEKNGDSSHQPDTWQNIKRDFPMLFGESTDT